MTKCDIEGFNYYMDKYGMPQHHDVICEALDSYAEDMGAGFDRDPLYIDLWILEDLADHYNDLRREVERKLNLNKKG